MAVDIFSAKVRACSAWVDVATLGRRVIPDFGRMALWWCMSGSVILLFLVHSFSLPTFIRTFHQFQGRLNPLYGIIFVIGIAFDVVILVPPFCSRMMSHSIPDWQNISNAVSPKAKTAKFTPFRLPSSILPQRHTNPVRYLVGHPHPMCCNK